jgi:hypothetical protein
MAVKLDDYANIDARGQKILYASDAQAYATAVAKEAIGAYAVQTAGANAKKTIENGENKMASKNAVSGILTDAKGGIQEAAQAVMAETLTNTGLIAGEILLENIETIADRLVLSRLSWWQKLTITKQNKELAVVLGTYAIVHCIKTGGFGLTKYRIDHKAIDFITLAANAKLMKAIIRATGVDTNIAGMLLSVPTVTKIIEVAE